MTAKPKVLVTGARFDPTTAIVRGLYKYGATVHVADSFKMAPALHSHIHATTAHVVPSPAHQPIRFTDTVAQIVRDHHLDMVIPTFEEGFYLARYADRLPVPLFAPSFETIAQLHSKAHFTNLCSQLGLPAPKTATVASRDELRETVKQFDDFVARPAYSRGGFVFLTNHGPRAGETSIDDCDPTSENPWLVQEFIDGKDACSFSVVHQGKIVLHCLYEPTIATQGGSAMQFISINDFGTFEKAVKIAEHFNYTGFLSFDYRRTQQSPDGFVMIECNPRACAGAFLTPEAWIGSAVFEAPGEVRMVEPGTRRQYDLRLLNPHFGKLSARQLLQELFTTPDVYLKPDDLLPALYSFLSYRYWNAVAHKEHISIVRAYLEDIAWDGTPMPEQTTTG